MGGLQNWSSGDKEQVYNVCVIHDAFDEFKYPFNVEYCGSLPTRFIKWVIYSSIVVLRPFGLG